MANHEQLPHHLLYYPEGIHIPGFVSMIRFPYGISNFPAIRAEGYLYLDCTQHIPLLEEAGKQLVSCANAASVNPCCCPRWQIITILKWLTSLIRCLASWKWDATHPRSVTVT